MKLIPIKQYLTGSKDLTRYVSLYRVTFDCGSSRRIIVVRECDARHAYDKAVELIERSGNSMEHVKGVEVEDLNAESLIGDWDTLPGVTDTHPSTSSDDNENYNPQD